MCCIVGSLGKVVLLDSEFEEAEFPLAADITPVEVSYDSALSPFPNLEMQHDKKRSMLIIVEKVDAMKVVKRVC